MVSHTREIRELDVTSSLYVKIHREARLRVESPRSAEILSYCDDPSHMNHPVH